MVFMMRPSIFCPGYLDHPLRKQGVVRRSDQYLGGEGSERTMTKTPTLERIIQVARTGGKPLTHLPDLVEIPEGMAVDWLKEKSSFSLLFPPMRQFLKLWREGPSAKRR